MLIKPDEFTKCDRHFDVAVERIEAQFVLEVRDYDRKAKRIEARLCKPDVVVQDCQHFLLLLRNELNFLKNHLAYCHRRLSFCQRYRPSDGAASSLGAWRTEFGASVMP